jgi:hypothetical protein
VPWEIQEAQRRIVRTPAQKMRSARLWRRKILLREYLREDMIFYEDRFSRRELEREELILRTLPYHANGYGKPRSERSGDNRTHTPVLTRAQAISYPINKIKLATRAARAHITCQESIVYRRAHRAALEAPSWSTLICINLIHSHKPYISTRSTNLSCVFPPSSL